MVTLDNSKKFLEISDVRVSYRKNDDSVHLTSSDPAFKQGFHLPLSKGTHTEKLLRGLLKSHDLVPTEEKNNLNALTIMAKLESGNPVEQSHLLAGQLTGFLGKVTVKERAKFENFLFTVFNYIKKADRSEITRVNLNSGVYCSLQSIFENKENFFDLIEATPAKTKDAYLKKLKAEGSKDMEFYEVCRNAFYPPG